MGQIEQLRGSPKHADQNMSAPRTLPSMVTEISSAEVSYSNQEVENGFVEIQFNSTSMPMRNINCEQLDFSSLGSSIDLTTGTVYRVVIIQVVDNKSSQILGLQEPDRRLPTNHVVEQIKWLKILYINIDTCLNKREELQAL